MKIQRREILKRIHYEKLSRLGEVPPAPGTTPIPENHVRLYHYTGSSKGGQTPLPEEELVKSIRDNGIDIGKSRTATYGEPHVIWASTQKPNRGKVYAEFSMHKDDPRWGIGKPRNQDEIDWLHRSGADVTFNDSINPHEIMAVHAPWHETYRYLQENNMIPRVVEGEFDYLLKNPENTEAKAISYIKARHGHPS